jgi:hypothetical protein
LLGLDDAARENEEHHQKRAEKQLSGSIRAHECPPRWG